MDPTDNSPLDRDSFISRMKEGLASMQIEASHGSLERLFLFYSELQRWNRKINLVSRQHPDWVGAHFLDSLAPLALGLIKGDERVVDLGAGAGFPGLPLKLLKDDLFLAMAEASQKKCTWLKHLRHLLEVQNAEVLEGRFEDLLQKGWAGNFGVAVSRAAAKPWKILDLARGFLAPGGRALVYTTEALASGEVGRVHPYRIPGSRVPSVIWEVEVK